MQHEGGSFITSDSQTPWPIALALHAGDLSSNRGRAEELSASRDLAITMSQAYFSFQWRR